MNLEQFNGFLNTPATLNGQSLPLLSELVKEYPYFQTAQILLAKNLHNEKNIRYNAQLKIAAAYSTDRKKLYKLINGIAEVEQKIIQPVLKEEKKEIPQEKPVEKVKTEQPILKKKEVENVEPVVKKQEQISEETHTFTEIGRAHV